MSDLYMPQSDVHFLEATQPNYAFEYTEKEFVTGYLYRLDTSSRFPAVEPIRLVYSKADFVYLQLISDFYHARQMSDDFFIDPTNLLAVNPTLRINNVGKWVFSAPVNVNQLTFGAVQVIDVTITVQQLI